MKTCVAIPVGGRVVNKYLLETLSALKGVECEVIVGLDEKASIFSTSTSYKETVEICNDLSDKVLLFPSESYYRRGGIWLKALKCWQSSKAPYLRIIGYDDLIPSEAIVQQELVLDRYSELDACYSNMTIQNLQTGSEIFQETELSKFGLLNAISRNPFSFMAWLIRREAVLDPLFESYTVRCASAFEYFLFAWLTKRNLIMHVRTTKSGSPIRRDHSETVTAQYEQQGLSDHHSLVKEARLLTNYSAEETALDLKTCELQNFYRAVRNQISPFIGPALSVYREKLRR